MNIHPEPIIHTMPQRSIEWLLIKQGKFSATDMATVANGTAEGRRSLCWKKAKERIDNCHEPLMEPNAAMQWGIDHEDKAIAKYSWETGNNVQIVGFVEYSDMFGFSPDGLIGDDGGLEVKCPSEKTYNEYADKKAAGKNWIKSSYMWQMQSSLYMSARDWWDFNVYYPEKPRLIERVLPDNNAFSKIKDGMELCYEWVRNIERAQNGKS